MNLPDIVVATTPVVEAFEQLGISYYIGGSVASSTHGIARATLDVDLVASILPSHVAPLVERLKDAYYIDAVMIRDALQRRSVFNLVHLATMLKLDIYVLKERPFDQESFRRRRLDTLEAVNETRRFYLASAEDVLLHKLEWFLLGGEVSERQWNDILGVLKVQARALDFDYLSMWAKDLKLEKLLSRAMVEAGLAPQT